MYEIFWMLVGAAIAGLVVHLYHNKNFKAALDEERKNLKQKINQRL